MRTVLARVRDGALKRPWLAAPPLLGVVAQRVLWSMSAPDAGPGGAYLRGFAGAVLTVAVTAAFAELWLGDGAGLDAGRFADTGLLFLLPYPLLLLVGAASTPLVYGLLHSGAGEGLVYGVLYAVVALGKLSAYAFGAASSLAVARRGEAKGIPSALALGFKTLWANAGFFALLLPAAWVLQEACAFAARAAGLGIVSGVFTTAIPLLACVAAPIEAWRAGTLRQ